MSWGTLQSDIIRCIYIDAPAVRFQDSNTDGTLDNTLYYMNDANFNVTALIDESGSVVERYSYDPYGSVTISEHTTQWH